MRLICPNCDAQYEVADSAIPDDGRDVQCSSCGQTWFQKSAYMLEEESIKAAKAKAADPAPTPPVQVEDPTPEPEITVEAPDPEPTVKAQPAVQEPPRQEPAHRKPSDSALEILREEAEIAAKSRQNQPNAGIETQPDLGLETPAKDPAPKPQIVQERHTDLQDVAQKEIAHRSRRDLLPDIEEINSTLRASSDRNADIAGDSEASIDLRRKRRRGFRLGFGSILLLTAALIIAYIYTPQIIEKVPQTQPYLSKYVDGVNDLRNWLEVIMKKATDNMTNN